MTLPLQSYTWDRVRYALARYVEFQTGLSADAPAGGTSNIAWADNDQGPMPKPYVSMQRLSARNLGFADEYYRDVPTQQRLTVTQTVVGEPVRACLIWSTVSVDVQAGDTLTDSRDAWLAAAQAQVAQTREPLIFAADGASDVLITAKPFAYPDVQAVQGCTLTDPPLAEARSYVASVSKLYRVRLQLHGFGIAGDEALDEYDSMLRTGLETTRGLDFLRPYGVGVQGNPSETQNVTIKEGALRVPRSFFDISIVTRQTTYTFDAAQRPAIDETIDQADPPDISGISV